MKHQTLIESVKDLLITGYSRTRLLNYVQASTQGKITLKECDRIIEQAKQLLEKETNLDPHSIILSHISLYEKIYEYFKEINFKRGMNRALKQKEKLLNLIGGSSHTVELNQTATVSSDDQKDVGYDRTKLTPEENERLTFLIKKMTVQ